MSQHPSDRDAARRRILDLEAQLAEREAALSTEDLALAERDAEIARLRRQLGLARPLGPRLVPGSALQRPRWVVFPIAAAGAAFALSVVAVRAPRPVVVEIVSAPSVAPEPVVADPAPVVLVEPERAAIPREEALPPREAPGVDLQLRAGETLIAAGHAREAITILEAARKERPNSAEANHLLGRALLLGGDAPREAIRYLELALAIDPSRAEAHLLLGKAYQGQPDAQKAAEHYRRYLALAPPGDPYGAEATKALREASGGRAD